MKDLSHTKSVHFFYLKSGIKHKALSLRNMSLVNKLDVTPNVLCTKITEELALLCHLEMHMFAAL